MTWLVVALIVKAFIAGYFFGIWIERRSNARVALARVMFRSRRYAYASYGAE